MQFWRAGWDTLCRLTLNGFNSLESLSSGICQPQAPAVTASISAKVLGLFLLSKELAPVMLISAGESMDAWHISAPHPQGTGAAQAMQPRFGHGWPAGRRHWLFKTCTAHQPSRMTPWKFKAVQTVFAGYKVALSKTSIKPGIASGRPARLKPSSAAPLISAAADHAGALDAELADQNYVPHSRLEQSPRYAMSNSSPSAARISV